jgi:hypothetical protein
MLKFLALFILCCSPIVCLSQDLIIKKDGGEIEGKVVEITLSEVKYQSSPTSESPLISLPTGELLLVKFANGKNHVFKEYGPKFKVGQQHGGGIIFYVDHTGSHGLIAAKQDYGKMMRWGMARRRVGASSHSDGSKNTKTIVSYTGSYCAADKCQNLADGGFNDWYLPAIEELYRLYQARDFVPGLFRPGKNDYCSSTEHTNRNDCLGIHFGRAGKQFYYNKREPYHVRAVRKF